MSEATQPMREVQASPRTAARRTASRDRDLHSRVESAVSSAVDHLLSLQFSGEYWWGELEADTTLESDYILFHHILGEGKSEKVRKLANCIRESQIADGGWNLYPDGPAELNVSVKSYYALKFAGDSPDAPHMLLARKRIHEMGGLESANSYVRFYLAMVGVLDWNLAPSIPPELLLLPAWLPVNLYEMSSWTRAIIIPLSIIYALRPHWRIAVGMSVDDVSVDELFADPANKAAAFRWSRGVFSWRNFFLAADRFLKLHERLPWKPFRRRALAKASAWLFEHVERSEGLASIYPAMSNSIYAMLALGYPKDDPLINRERGWILGYEIEERDTVRLQPCISPVWDTAIAMVSLEEAGLDPAHDSLRGAGRWLIDHQILGPGDWQVKNKDAAPGGWAFEFRNDFYPDVDDSAFVLMALQRVAHSDPARFEASARRGLAWLLSMQNRDGGWGAFDRDNDRSFLTNIPFADHNAMIDPSSADVTARAIECLGNFGWPAEHPAIRRALAYLRREQSPEGAWYGRWGSNYVYGTSGVLRALEVIGRSQCDESRRGAEWLRRVQNPDGGFGESVVSYETPARKGEGESTASQTAWGLIGLLAVVGAEDPAAERAASWLVEHQNGDGSWTEDDYTGTGFPCVFYMKYHLYRNSFPLYALARYRNLRQENRKMTEWTRFNTDEFSYRNGHGGKR
ncbi:MAG TPA: squalene--hopene cyclase [Candidatus Acidoferrales bacterium]|nr:squalene--hopene cyclase [Candidatus Acidoferrales bacterium]